VTSTPKENVILSIIWTPSQDAILVSIRDIYPHETWATVAAMVTKELGFNVTKDMARNRFNRATALKRSIVPDEGDTVESLKLALNDARVTIENLQTQRADIGNAIETAILKAASGMDIPPVLAPEQDARDLLAGHYGVLLGSDWQMGKLINGHYDSAIAIQRVNEWIDESIQRFMGHAHPIAEVHLLLLGDHLENETIFPAQASRIDASLYRQVFDVAQTLANGIRRLLSVFPLVYVQGVGGNHGYNQKNSHPETNFDCRAMNVARLMLAEEDRLNFPEPLVTGESNWYMLHEVGEQVFFGIHGNQCRSKPFTQAMRDRLANYHATMGGFDVAVTGHYHQALNADIGAFDHFAAGSTESGNTFAQEWLAAGAQQGSQWTLITDGTQIVDRHLIRLN